MRCYCDVFPMSEVKIIKHKAVESNDNLEENKHCEKQPENVSKEFRVNEVNIQMISKNIYNQLFKTPSPPVDPQVIKSCQENLLKHGINYKEFTPLPDVQLKLPPLEGKDVIEHFYNIGEKQSAPYRQLLTTLATCKLPAVPKKWSRKSGWSKYVGDKVYPVPCPPDDALIFDVEVLMSASKRPTLACAVSKDAWYGWISQPVANGDPHQQFDEVTYESLIPMETDDQTSARVIVGHNVSYDRAKIKEQYWLQKTGLRFMDTMSMHTCVSGVTSYQRAVLKTRNKEPDPGDEDWIEITSLNSLTEVTRYLTGS
ncbi:DNA polymerase subunit gamma-1 [Phthorimaea operculella]|nr:DNA polymerase subunit gamma-1 [Phthorimaea operculella]